MTTRKMLAIVALGLLVVACSGEGEADVTVTLQDDGIDLTSDTLSAGDLTFEGVNEGTMTHEFEVFAVPEGVDANNLPVEGETAPADEMLEVIDEIEDIAPGTSATLNLNLDAGNYAVICNLPGHYANGMHTTFVVE
ncbi:MAG TPA: plastocyanin/azurin family copper-binding protein [Actinomycetota bacterium]|nr:plastocyanin/azurin family copper-binding protein [Actinomycetota bacterium]